MKPYLATFIVDGRVLGQSEITTDIQPHSLCYVCATCGEIWGRIFVRDDDAMQYWDVEVAPCAKHLPRGVPDWGKVPGSFLIGTDLRKGSIRTTAWARAIEHLPQGVLTREFGIHEVHYLRKIKDEQDDQSRPDGS